MVVRRFKIRLFAALVLALPTGASAHPTLCPNMVRQLRKDAFQYPKKQQDAIIKAAIDLDEALRTKIKPPFGYMVCAGMAMNFFEPQVEVWTDRKGCTSENRWSPIPQTFEGQRVWVYCENEGKLM
jgi:hypothetical protein